MGGSGYQADSARARLKQQLGCHRPYGPGLPEVGLLLIELIRASGIDRALSTALALWRKPLAVRDSGQILLDLAIMLVLGGDCLADVNQPRQIPAAPPQPAGLHRTDEVPASKPLRRRPPNLAGERPLHPLHGRDQPTHPRGPFRGGHQCPETNRAEGSPPCTAGASRSRHRRDRHPLEARWSNRHLGGAPNSSQGPNPKPAVRRPRPQRCSAMR
jgi:hypothetical protein